MQRDGHSLSPGMRNKNVNQVLESALTSSPCNIAIAALSRKKVSGDQCGYICLSSRRLHYLILENGFAGNAQLLKPNNVVLLSLN